MSDSEEWDDPEPSTYWHRVGARLLCSMLYTTTMAVMIFAPYIAIVGHDTPVNDLSTLEALVGWVLVLVGTVVVYHGVGDGPFQKLYGLLVEKVGSR